MRASCLNSIFAKITGEPVHERLTTLVERKAVVLKRDDLTAELLSLWNASGHYADAAAILDTRVFHPGRRRRKITGQYLLNQLHRALEFIERGAFKQATDCLKAALRYPDNLGRGDCWQTDNDIWYLLGYCAEQAGDAQQRRNITSLPGKGLNAGRRAVLQRSTRRLPFLAGHCAA